MPISAYLAGLRAKVGSDLILVPSVSVIPRDDQGRVLLVRHVEDARWGLIGGAVDPGESPAAAAVREAEEEAGVTVRLGRILTAVGGPDFEMTYANGDRCAYVAVIYDGTVVAGRPAPDEQETSEVAWFAESSLDLVDLNHFARSVFADLRAR